jgi:DNA-binding transcriptional ArsR family regulator
MENAEDIDLDLLKENAQQAASLLKVLSNEWRLLILCHLATGEKSVGELETILGIGQSALSQHLAILRREKLVKTRRKAQSVYYVLDSDDVKAIMGTLYECFCRPD